MCDVTDGFRLCTCPTTTGVPADWSLTRPGPGDFKMDGMFVMEGFIATPTEEDELRALYLLDGLNQGGCFDFEYTPQEGDRFTFCRGRVIRLRYRDGSWQEDTGSELPWGTPLAAGSLELAAEAGLAESPGWEALLADPYNPARRAALVNWLRQQGRTTLVRWFEQEERVHQGLPAPELHDLAKKISLHLRARFAHAPLPCKRARCPGDWALLKRIPSPLTRRCLRCHKAAVFTDAWPSNGSGKALRISSPGAQSEAL
ncbi:MAG: hypothetical protein ACI8RZ_000095 [Myxococcota bacterium]|jgi:hypothetical protein